MQVSVNTTINSSPQAVWETVTDIEHSADFISAITDLKILHTPTDGFVGLKWIETRLMFGKSASETMWITEATALSYYCTRAESHGSVYLTKIDLCEMEKGQTQLSMLFTAQPQSIAIKIISLLMGPFIKGAMAKALQKDLDDIKHFIEAKN